MVSYSTTVTFHSFLNWIVKPFFSRNWLFFEFVWGSSKAELGKPCNDRKYLFSEYSYIMDKP